MIKLSGTMEVTRDTTQYQHRTRVYFFHRDETVTHALSWRYDRPIQWYFDLLPTVLRLGGAGVTDEEERAPTQLGAWEQYAGCQCGSSPAIVLRSQGRRPVCDD